MLTYAKVFKHSGRKKSRYFSVCVIFSIYSEMKYFRIDNR